MSRPHSETHTIERPDGAVLRGRSWHPRTGEMPGMPNVVLVHGLGEHVGRYEALAAFFVERGFTVFAFDQRGHGRSDGPRGGLHADTDLVDDLGAVVDASCGSPGSPVLLFGHSLGGLVALSLALRHPVRVDRLVLSSPVLAPRLNARSRTLIALTSRIVPDVATANRLDPSTLSHDEQVVHAYHDDPLVHDRITPRLARFTVEASHEALERAAALAMPTLLLFAGDDRTVDPQGSRRFAQRAPHSLLVAREYRRAWHEIFNEEPALRAEAFDDLRAWLESREPIIG